MENCCSKSEIDFFSPRPIQTVMQNGKSPLVYPTSSVSSNTPIEFNISGSSEDYIDLSQTELIIRCKVTKADGTTALGAGANESVVNNFMHSLFSDVALTLGDKQVEGGNFMYPYRAYLHNLLTYGSGPKRCQLQTSGWFKDDAGKHYGEITAEGWKRRASWIEDDDEIEFCGPLCLDMFVQDKYLLNNVDMKIKLSHSKPEFVCMIQNTATNPSVKINLTSAMLKVRRVSMTPSIVLENESMLATRNALYPLQHTEMITYTIPRGTLSHNKESLFRNHIPKLVIVGMVTNAAFNGSYNTNPFQFQHFDMNHIALFKDGESIPGAPYTPNFSSKRAKTEYNALFKSLDLYTVDDSNNITYEDFLDGYTLMAFNLTPDMSISGHAQPVRDGNLRLELRFEKALPSTINVVVLAIFDGQLEITKQRDIILDYTL